MASLPLAGCPAALAQGPIPETRRRLGVGPRDTGAAAELAGHYRACHEASGERRFAAAAAELYRRVALAAQEEGRLAHTSELAELYGALGERQRLEEVFQPLLTTPGLDPGQRALAHLDYARGLALLGDPGTDAAFRRAVEERPQGSVEAVNRYARYLLDQDRAAEAVELLESELTAAERIRAVQPAYLAREARQRAGLDTAAADREVQQIEARRRDGGERR